MYTASIHIVTYNSSEHIDDCLEAVIKQSYPINQIVIIDNASKTTRLRSYKSGQIKFILLKMRRTTASPADTIKQ